MVCATARPTGAAVTVIAGDAVKPSQLLLDTRRSPASPAQHAQQVTTSGVLQDQYGSPCAFPTKSMQSRQTECNIESILIALLLQPFLLLLLLFEIFYSHDGLWPIREFLLLLLLLFLLLLLLLLQF